jgi:hypothetical protein
MTNGLSESLASSSMPVVQRVEHLAHNIGELVIAGRDFGRMYIILLFWQEGTKRQAKQLCKATEKTLIANGCGWTRGHCHVKRNADGCSGSRCDGRVAARLSSAKHAQCSARD